jgi:phenylalanyl-tRNA synthetase beta chain
VTRDISFASIKRSAETQGVEICRGVEFVDLYDGKGLAANERSLTVRFVYRSDERTLVEDEVEQVHSQILKRIEDDLKIKQRF